MLIRHCNRNFRVDDVWFLQSLNSLEPNKLFNNRKLLIGKCPKCGKDVVSLVSVRVSDNKYFVTTTQGRKAQRIMEREKPRILYKSSEVKKKVVQGGCMELALK